MLKKLSSYLSLGQKGVAAFFMLLLVGGALLLLFFVLLNLLPESTRSNLSFFQKRQQQERPSQAAVAVTGQKCPDVTGDNIVSISDITQIRDKFGSNSQSAGWDSKYDINGDGAVSTQDMTLAVAHFGQYCSTLTFPASGPETAIFSLNPPRSDSDVQLVAFSGTVCDVSKISNGISKNIEPNQTIVNTGALTPQTNYCIQLIKKQTETTYLRLSNPIGIITPPLAELELVKRSFPNRFEFRYSNISTIPLGQFTHWPTLGVWEVQSNNCNSLSGNPSPLTLPFLPQPQGGITYFNSYNSQFLKTTRNYCAALVLWSGSYQAFFSRPVAFKEEPFSPITYDISATMNFHNLQPNQTVEIWHGGFGGKLLAKQTGPGEISIPATSAPSTSASFGRTLFFTFVSNSSCPIEGCIVEFDFNNLKPEDAMAVCNGDCIGTYSVIGYGKVFKVQAPFNRTWVIKGIADGARFSPFPSQ